MGTGDGTSDILIIVNPAASGGRALRRWNKIAPKIRRRINPGPEIVFTTAPGDAQRFATAAAVNGKRVVVAAGGDGTANEVANGLIHNDRAVNPDCAMAVLPLGTGCDFARTLEVPPGIDQVIDVWLQQRPRLIDVGCANFQDLSHESRQRYFVNIMSFGLSSQVAWNVHHGSRSFSPRFTYLANVIKTLLTWKNVPAEIGIDGAAPESAAVCAMICANAKFFGGGMLPAPQADISDGRLNLVQVGDISPFEGLTYLPGLFRGTLANRRKAEHRFFKQLEAHSQAPLYVEIDGEFTGFLPLQIKVVPRVLPVIY